MLHDTAVYRASHAIFALCCANVAEERGISLSGCELTSTFDTLPDDWHAPIVWRCIGRIEQAWGFDLDLVFHHMGLETEDEQEHALTDLLLGCLGHGVTLAGDFAAELSRAGDVLLRYSGGCLKPVPVHFEDTEWRELAEEYFDSVYPIAA